MERRGPGPDRRAITRTARITPAWNSWDVLCMRATEEASGMIPRQEYELLALDGSAIVLTFPINGSSQRSYRLQTLGRRRLHDRHCRGLRLQLVEARRSGADVG